MENQLIADTVMNRL